MQQLTFVLSIRHILINVVDYVTNEIGLFRYKLFKPKKTTSTCRQLVDIVLISGYLVSIDFQKNETRQTKHNVANTVASKT